MKRLVLPLLFAGVVSWLGAGARTAGASVIQSATGSGMLNIQTPTASGFRAFAFNAKTFSDGSTSGQMQVVNNFNGNIVHASLDCLNIVGNAATISGTVTSSNNPLLDTFSAVVFTVVDNGEGDDGPPDMISFTFFDVPSPAFTCTTYFPAADQTIIGGNVQVNG
jgi:hypothetical protein